MHSVVKVVLLGMVVVITGCESATPPVAKIQPKELVAHGDVRVDDYFWLKEREHPDVIAYLEAENEYLDKMMRHTRKLQDELFEEIKGRIKPNDETVPYLLEGYYYYSRYEEGKEYAIHCRKRGDLEAPEEITLDGNRLAEGHEYFALRGLQVSSGRDILAFGSDTFGRRFYTLRFKNLVTGKMLPDVIPDVTGRLAWANDNKTLFYSRQDPETLRPYQIYRHVLGSDVGDDVLVYQEDDETFRCYVYKTKSRELIMIASSQSLSDEYRYLDATDPTGTFTLIQPRERNHEYSVDHYAGRFYFRTNWNAENFRLMESPVSDPGKANWREVIPHREDVYLSSFEIFADFLVLSERRDALNHLRVIPWDGSQEHDLDFGEPAYLAYISTNTEFDTTVLRYGYSSMTTPRSVFDYDMIRREKTLMKQDEVVGGFDSSAYRTERLWATARDGTRVPISIVYPRELQRDGSSPLLLYGYGSYGASMDATFSSARLSLLERGFAYAIAHVRGGQELGRRWYEDGKLLRKKNTFNDFIDCAEYLVAEGYTSNDRLFAMGASAGGLLMGAVLNMRPDLFQGVVAHVPWVDVVTTMFDSSIPLTTSEYDEWGDPNDKEYYDTMLSYSPYDNVEAKDYPNLLVTTGLHDSQVQYWEPAKWVAKLRALKTDDNLLLLKTIMEAGHGGATGRFKRHKETALSYAFMLDLVEDRD
jgi:oligopeptidase B